MKIFRVVDSSFSSLDKIWEAYGARRDGGRWNLPGTSAIYTSKEFETAISEKAFYSIIQPVYDFNKKKNPNDDKFERIVERSFVVVELDVSNTTLEDLTDYSLLQNHLTLYDSRLSYGVLDSRKSPYHKLPGRWTQHLGSSLASLKIPAIQAASARAKNGMNVVLFPNNCDYKNIKIVSQQDVKLSAVDTYGSKISYSQIASTKKILCESTKKSIVIDVEEFK